MVKICVFCGSSTPTNPQITDAVMNMCTLMAHYGWDLVYGGGKHGLMGTVASTFLQGGRNVTGIMPRDLHDVAGDNAYMPGTEHIQVADMFERKIEMMKRSDAFLILPGGIGTLDELTEVWSHAFFTGFCPRMPHTHSKSVTMPFITEGDKLTYALFEKRVEEGFISKKTMDLLHVGKPAESLLYLKEQLAVAA